MCRIKPGVAGRRFIAKVKNAEDFVKFMETYLKRAKASEIYVKYRGGRVEIRLRGNAVETKVSSVEARKAYGMLRSGRFNVYDLQLIFQRAEIKSPVPPEAVELTLRLMGKYAEIDGAKIRTNASANEVIRVVEDLSKAYADLVEFDSSSLAKRIIASYAVANGIGAFEAVDRLIEAGLLTRSRVNDRDYVTLRVGYQDAVDALLNPNRASGLADQ